MLPKVSIRTSPSARTLFLALLEIAFHLGGVRFLIILVILYTLPYLLAPMSAFAQTLFLGIYPPLLEVMIQPGKSITQVYKVKNSGDSVILTPQIVSFEPRDEWGTIYLLPNLLPPASKNWFALTNADRSLGHAFSLASGGTQELVLRIKIPQDAEEADHYFSFILTTSPPPPRGATKMGMKGTIASNILTTISKDGNPRKLAEIVQFSSPKIIDSFTKPVFNLKIKNTGQAFFKPQGSISIYNTQGHLSATLDLLEENVLVNSTRLIRCKTGDKVAPCQFEAKFLIGRYKAKLDFKVNGEIYRAEIVFLAFPFKLTLVLLTIIIFLFMMKNRFKLGLDKYF